jgi:hypothetical protein
VGDVAPNFSEFINRFMDLPAEDRARIIKAAKEGRDAWHAKMNAEMERRCWPTESYDSVDTPAVVPAKEPS